MTRPNCPSSCGRKRHHRVPYVSSPTASTEINTFKTSGKGFSGPRERQGKISFGMCSCLLISVPIIYSCKQAHARIRLAAMTCVHMYLAAISLIQQSSRSSAWPKPSVRTDITSKLSQVSKQAWDGEVISLRCKRRSRKIVWVFLNNTFKCTNKRSIILIYSANIQKHKRVLLFAQRAREHVTPWHTGQPTVLESQHSRVRVLHDKKEGRGPYWCCASFNRCS